MDEIRYTYNLVVYLRYSGYCYYYYYLHYYMVEVWTALRGRDLGQTVVGLVSGAPPDHFNGNLPKLRDRVVL